MNKVKNILLSLIVMTWAIFFIVGFSMGIDYQKEKQEIMDIDNFNNFTKEEYKENLKRLSITSHSDLVGKEVYYCKTSYGPHKVEKWNRETGEYLLNCDGSRFYTNPFRIKLK